MDTNPKTTRTPIVKAPSLRPRQVIRESRANRILAVAYRLAAQAGIEAMSGATLTADESGTEATLSLPAMEIRTSAITQYTGGFAGHCEAKITHRQKHITLDVVGSMAVFYSLLNKPCEAGDILADGRLMDVPKHLILSALCSLAEQDGNDTVGGGSVTYDPIRKTILAKVVVARPDFDRIGLFRKSLMDKGFTYDLGMSVKSGMEQKVKGTPDLFASLLNSGSSRPAPTFPTNSNG